VLKQENKVKKIGFSLNEPKELDLLLNKGMMPDLIQVPYNYFDNRFKDVLIDLKAKGCEIHTRSAFLQGLFFSDIQKLPSFFDEIKKNITELQINYENNLTGALLKYVLALDFVDVVIMGVENEKQLKMNLININTAHHLSPKNFNFSDLVLMPSNWPKIV
jgi:aryl-alcohol dehydrogenase-like predicted oxidoreductase